MLLLVLGILLAALGKIAVYIIALSHGASLEETSTDGGAGAMLNRLRRCSRHKIITSNPSLEVMIFSRSGCPGHRMPRIGESQCQTPGAIGSYAMGRAGHVEKVLHRSECGKMASSLRQAILRAEGGHNWLPTNMLTARSRELRHEAQLHSIDICITI